MRALTTAERIVKSERLGAFQIGVIHPFCRCGFIGRTCSVVCGRLVRESVTRLRCIRGLKVASGTWVISAKEVFDQSGAGVMRGESQGGHELKAGCPDLHLQVTMHARQERPLVRNGTPTLHHLPSKTGSNSVPHEVPQGGRPLSHHRANAPHLCQFSSPQE